jgi:hypothetical protein
MTRCDALLSAEEDRILCLYCEFSLGGSQLLMCRSYCGTASDTASLMTKLLRPYLHPPQPPIDRINIKRLGIKIPSDPLDRARVIRVSFVAQNP